MPDYDDYQRLLSDLDATVECSEAHGILCGMLSLDPTTQGSDWLGLEEESPKQLFTKFLAKSHNAQHTDSSEDEYNLQSEAIASPQGAPQEHFLSDAIASPQGAPQEHFLSDAIASPQGAAIAELATLHRETRTQLNSLNYEFNPLLPDDNETIAQRTQALSLWCQGFLFGLSVSGLKTLDALSAASREIIEDFSAIAQLEEQFEEGEDEESAYMELVEYLRVGTFTIADENSKQPDGETLH
ncbi:MAG: UPF0149 family protein [Gammaproteobacteria bacterium]|nr:UPF0149 family protein [Gammaproteobacteria bacterium]